ncbi:MAG: hypothetical protein WHS87_02120 [Anaerolineales bacterium]
METFATLEALKKVLGKSDAEVLALAVESGVRHLWRDVLLGKYLRGELTREEAIDAVGIDWVELAERQKAAMEADLAWALQP